MYKTVLNCVQTFLQITADICCQYQKLHSVMERFSECTQCNAPNVTNHSKTKCFKNPTFLSDIKWFCCCKSHENGFSTLFHSENLFAWTLWKFIKYLLLILTCSTQPSLYIIQLDHFDLKSQKNWDNFNPENVPESSPQTALEIEDCMVIRTSAGRLPDVRII